MGWQALLGSLVLTLAMARMVWLLVQPPHRAYAVQRATSVR